MFFGCAGQGLCGSNLFGRAWAFWVRHLKGWPEPDIRIPTGQWSNMPHHSSVKTGPIISETTQSNVRDQKYVISENPATSSTLIARLDSAARALSPMWHKNKCATTQNRLSAMALAFNPLAAPPTPSSEHEPCLHRQRLPSLYAAGKTT